MSLTVRWIPSSPTVRDQSRPTNHGRLAYRDRVGRPRKRQCVRPAWRDSRRQRHGGRRVAARRSSRPTRLRGWAALPSGRPVSRAMKTEVSSSPGPDPVTPRRGSGRRVRRDRWSAPGRRRDPRSCSRRLSPTSHRARRPWGTMSAMGSPRTVSVTRSPACTASIT